MSQKTNSKAGIDIELWKEVVEKNKNKYKNDPCCDENNPCCCMLFSPNM